MDIEELKSDLKDEHKINALQVHQMWKMRGPREAIPYYLVKVKGSEAEKMKKAFTAVSEQSRTSAIDANSWTQVRREAPIARMP